MEFGYGGFSSVYRRPSASTSSAYSNISHQAPEEGLSRRRSEFFREHEKKMIREELLAEEAERRRVLKAEVRRELMMEWEMMEMQSRHGYASSFTLAPPQFHHNRFPPGVRETRGLEVVIPTFQRRLQSPEIPVITTSMPKDSEKEMFGLGKPFSPTPSGVKRKRRQHPSPAVVGGSTELCYRSKRKVDEWSCALCKVSTTSERDLQGHLAGKKHQAKAAGLRDAGKKVISNHKKGKRHSKNFLKSGRKSRGKSGSAVCSN